APSSSTSPPSEPAPRASISEEGGLEHLEKDVGAGVHPDRGADRTRPFLEPAEEDRREEDGEAGDVEIPQVGGGEEELRHPEIDPHAHPEDAEPSGPPCLLEPGLEVAAEEDLLGEGHYQELVEAEEEELIGELGSEGGG